MTIYAFIAHPSFGMPASWYLLLQIYCKLIFDKILRGQFDLDYNKIVLRQFRYILIEMIFILWRLDHKLLYWIEPKQVWKVNNVVLYEIWKAYGSLHNIMSNRICVWLFSENGSKGLQEQGLTCFMLDKHEIFHFCWWYSYQFSFRHSIICGLKVDIIYNKYKKQQGSD